MYRILETFLKVSKRCDAREGTLSKATASCSQENAQNGSHADLLALPLPLFFHYEYCGMGAHVALIHEGRGGRYG